MAFLPGSEGGAAVADTLFGKANPSGRLSVSWPKDSSQFPLAYNEPGKAYDPRYEFGYGLSYTRFDVGRPHVWGSHVSVSVRNAGKQAGDHTLLAFAVGSDGSRRLVGFTRVHLDPHQRTTARLTLTAPAGGRIEVS
jgi:beta-glucosidase